MSPAPAAAVDSAEVTGRWYLLPKPDDPPCTNYIEVSKLAGDGALEGVDSRGNAWVGYFESHEPAPFGRLGALVLFPPHGGFAGLSPTAVRQILPPEAGSPVPPPGVVRTYVLFKDVARGATLGAANRLYRCTPEQLRLVPLAPPGVPERPEPPLDRELPGAP